jgi:hypothetical protein
MRNHVSRLSFSTIDEQKCLNTASASAYAYTRKRGGEKECVKKRKTGTRKEKTKNGKKKNGRPLSPILVVFSATFALLNALTVFSVIFRLHVYNLMAKTTY